MEEMQCEMNTKLSALIAKFEALESALLSVTTENETLKCTVAEQAEELAELRNSLNDREQYARNWSMRILNLEIPKESEVDTRFVMKLSTTLSCSLSWKVPWPTGTSTMCRTATRYWRQPTSYQARRTARSPSLRASTRGTGATWCSATVRSLHLERWATQPLARGTVRPRGPG